MAVGISAVQLFLLSPALAAVKDIILHVPKSLKLPSFAAFPSCSVTRRPAEEKTGSKAASLAFEAGRAAFAHLSLETFQMTLACEGVTAIQTQLPALLQQCLFQIYCNESGEIQHGILPRGFVTTVKPPAVGWLLVSLCLD